MTDATQGRSIPCLGRGSDGSCWTRPRALDPAFPRCFGRAATGKDEPVAHAEAVAQVAVDADTLWRAIGSFQGIGEWHPMLDQVEGDGEEPGAIRRAIGKDGSEQVECLYEVDPVQRFYRYTIVSRALQVRDYIAELQVQPKDDGTSTVSWTSDFETTGDQDETVGMIQGFLEAGVQSLAERYR
ncbi:MAG TPA: SRPBCC family protein [Miltoncostaeaceae bacterium]|nr:SRPBCC family protein [Miltoncostaeaceae bacterium]